MEQWLEPPQVSGAAFYHDNKLMLMFIVSPAELMGSIICVLCCFLCMVFMYGIDALDFLEISFI